MINQFNSLVSTLNLPWKLENILPNVLTAGEKAGELTAEGAKLLDTSGKLRSGIPLCPPEGDAGTGMVATKSITVRTGNVSAGTSVFSMIVLDKELSEVYPEIDLVTTPSGDLVAMVHSNNCTSDYDAWIKLFVIIKSLGMEVDKRNFMIHCLVWRLMGSRLRWFACICYISGEHNSFRTRPSLFVRSSNSSLIANFMRVHLFTALAL